MTDLDDAAGRFILAVGRLRRRLKQLPVGGGIPGPEMTALVRLDREGPATASYLAKAEQISPQSMSATLAALESRGLIARTADPSDGRRVLLSVTPAGRETIEAKRAVRTRQIAAALGRLDEADIAVLRAAVPALERLAANL